MRSLQNRCLSLNKWVVWVSLSNHLPAHKHPICLHGVIYSYGPLGISVTVDPDIDAFPRTRDPFPLSSREPFPFIISVLLISHVNHGRADPCSRSPVTIFSAVPIAPATLGMLCSYSSSLSHNFCVCDHAPSYSIKISVLRPWA